MPDSLMYYEDNYVVLTPSMQEQFVTAPELAQILQDLLAGLQDDLPRDLQSISDIQQQAQRLIKTACELDCVEKGIWQWYAVRLDKSK
jgi:Protein CHLORORESPIRATORY REDUCTION 7